MSLPLELDKLLKQCRSDVSIALCQLFVKVNTLLNDKTSLLNSSTISSYIQPLLHLITPLEQYITINSSLLSSQNIQYCKRQIQFLSNAIFDVESKLLTLVTQQYSSVQYLSSSIFTENCVTHLLHCDNDQANNDVLDNQSSSVSQESPQKQYQSVRQQEHVDIQSSKPTHQRIRHYTCEKLSNVIVLFITSAQYLWLSKFIKDIFNIVSKQYNILNIIDESTSHLPYEINTLCKLSVTKSEELSSINDKQIQSLNKVTELLISITLQNISTSSSYTNLSQSLLSTPLQQLSDNNSVSSHLNFETLLSLKKISNISHEPYIFNCDIQSNNFNHTDSEIYPPLILQNNHNSYFIQFSHHFLFLFFHALSQYTIDSIKMSFLQSSLSQSSIQPTFQFIYSLLFQLYQHNQSNNKLGEKHTLQPPELIFSSCSIVSSSSIFVFLPYVMTSSHITKITKSILAIQCHQLRLHQLEECIVLTSLFINNINSLYNAKIKNLLSFLCQKKVEENNLNVFLEQEYLKQHHKRIEPIIEHSDAVLFAPFDILFQYHLFTSQKIFDEYYNTKSNNILNDGDNNDLTLSLLSSNKNIREQTVLVHNFNLLVQPTSGNALSQDPIDNNLTYKSFNNNKSFYQQIPQLSGKQFGYLDQCREFCIFKDISSYLYHVFIPLTFPCD